MVWPQRGDRNVRWRFKAGPREQETSRRGSSGHALVGGRTQSSRTQAHSYVHRRRGRRVATGAHRGSQRSVVILSSWHRAPRSPTEMDARKAPRRGRANYRVVRGHRGREIAPRRGQSGS